MALPDIPSRTKGIKKDSRENGTWSALRNTFLSSTHLICCPGTWWSRAGKSCSLIWEFSHNTVLNGYVIAVRPRDAQRTGGHSFASCISVPPWGQLHCLRKAHYIASSLYSLGLISQSGTLNPPYAFSYQATFTSFFKK